MDKRQAGKQAGQAMSEPGKHTGGLLGEALRREIKEIVREAVGEAAGNEAGGSPALLDIEQAAKFLNLPKSWVAEAARRKELPSIKAGHYVRFCRADLEKFIEQKKTVKTVRR